MVCKGGVGRGEEERWCVREGWGEGRRRDGV